MSDIISDINSLFMRNQRAQFVTAEQPVSGPRPEWVIQIREKGFYTIQKIKNMPPVDVTLHFCPITDPDQVPMHNHDFFELIYVYQGQGLHMMPDQRMILQQGDLILMNPNAVHAVHTDREEDCIINILIQKSILNDAVLSLLKDNSLISEFLVNYLYQVNRTADSIYFPADSEYSIEPYIGRLVQELQQQDFHYESMVHATLIALFTTLTRIYERRDENKTGNTEETRRIIQIVAYINNNISTVTLQELAAVFNYSVSHISRLIRFHTGKGFKEIVHGLKLEKARQYLDSSTLSVETITELVGFNDVSYLHRVFKKQYGISPAGYRKDCVKKAVNQ